MTEQLVLPLTHVASLELVGGKAQSLSRLCNAGYRIPKGEILTTTAYDRFVDAHAIRERLLDAALPDIQSETLVFTDAEARVRALFDGLLLTGELTELITRIYDKLEGHDRALAVRSSATVEDRPTHSFAGQHATYLNITSLEALIESVRNCWASLWSERALSYRHQVGIKNNDIAMGVVVQQLISVDVAGVAFTANPVSGARNEIYINASHGLGEAVVSGSVDPDEFVLDRTTFEVKSSRLGSRGKQTNKHSGQDFDDQSVETEPSAKPCLASSQLNVLGDQAIAVEKLFGGTPQDIEWAFGEGELWLLQSRAITRLPPEPLEHVRWDPPEPGAYLQRSQFVEHVPDPVCTLFEDLHMRRSLQEAWGRNLTRRGNHDFEDTQPPACFQLTTTVNGFAYRHVGEPPRTGNPVPTRKKRHSRFARHWSTVRIYLTFTPMWRYVALPRYLRQIQLWGKLDPSSASIEQLWKGIRALSKADAGYWFNGGVWNAFSLSRGTEAQLQNFLHEFGTDEFTSGHFLRGLKSAAFDSQATLYRIAELIRSDKQLCGSLIKHSPQQMLEILASHPQAQTIETAINEYFLQFGHQLRTLDFGEPLEIENPLNTLRSLHAYLLQPSLDPARNRDRLRLEQRQAQKRAAKHFRGKLRLKFWWRIWIARRYYPYREAAMFHLGRAWTVLRPLAIKLGQRLVERGTLRKADDVFYLTSEELGRAIRSIVSIDRLPDAHRKAHYPKGATLPEFAQRAIERRTLMSRRKSLTPPFLIPGPPPWAPLASERQEETSGNVLRGSPVSPGHVTGEACVIRTLEEFAEFRPGTILVCPTTTPAWSVLFPQLIGLVTDIGGILAHGSIVAREFGIPAVLGLLEATEKIQDGQTITVNGDSGTVELE